MTILRNFTPASGPLGETMADRARRQRRAAVASRLPCIIQTSSDGTRVEEHRFPRIPRLSEVLARLGPNAVLVGIRFGQIGEGSGKPAAILPFTDNRA